MRVCGSYPISLQLKTPAGRLALVIPYLEPVVNSVKQGVTFRNILSTIVDFVLPYVILPLPQRKNR